jgi:hypothetical protein
LIGKRSGSKAKSGIVSLIGKRGSGKTKKGGSKTKSGIVSLIGKK